MKEQEEENRQLKTVIELYRIDDACRNAEEAERMRRKEKHREEEKRLRKDMEAAAKDEREARERLEKARNNYDMAVRLDSETNGQVEGSLPQPSRSQRVPVQEAMPGKQKHDLSKWLFSKLKATINPPTSHDDELVEACRHEVHRRVKRFYDFQLTRARKMTFADPQIIWDIVKSMNSELNHNYPSTAPPPYSAPAETVTRQPFVPSNNGQYSTYTTYPNQPTVTVVHSPPIVSGIQHIVIANNMSPNPSPYTCPSCNLQIITRTERKSTIRTHLCAAILCLFALWPCAIIPYCMNSCNNIDHYCPNCSTYIGSYMTNN